jgi:UDP:flavonoid glycosyltransferase YjiC (YdhE family)
VRESVYLELAPPALRLPGERIWRHARPLRPRPGPPAAGEDLPAALAALPYRRTVHLTLGTVFHTPEALATVLDGLRALPVNVVATVGPDVDPARFGPQPRHVLLAPYLPHSLLLPHCDAVVSQGGAGIMFGALAHGLPQLVLPQGGDQFLNAEACRAAGAALTLAPGEITGSAVAEATGRLLAEPGFAAAAGAVRVEIAAMPDADAVLAGLTSSPTP